MPTPRALILGGQGRLAFSGHFRFEIAGPVQLWGAGVIGSSSDPVHARELALMLREKLITAVGSNRHSLVRAVWELLAQIPAQELGSARGEDLALLLIARDPAGEVIACTGLERIYRVKGDSLEELIPAAHPMLGLTGIPQEPPGVLAPHEPGLILVGSSGSYKSAVPSPFSYVHAGYRGS